MSSLDLSLSFTGFFIGFLTNSLGGGGGGLFVGILTSFFNIPGAVAVSTSLATVLPTTIAGSWSHWRNGNIKLSLGLPMAAGGIGGAVVGSLFSSKIPPSLYKPMFAALFLYITVEMVLKYFKKEKPKPPNTPVQSSDRWKGVAFGVFGGVLSGVLGISGTPPILIGLMVLGCSVIQMIGTSVFVLAAISAAGFLAHLHLGDVHWNLVLPLASGSVLGGLSAPWVISRVKRETLEAVYRPIVLVLTLLVTGVMIYRLVSGR
jgi:uncharacterized membrane protein YfcA